MRRGLREKVQRVVDTTKIPAGPRSEPVEPSPNDANGLARSDRARWLYRFVSPWYYAFKCDRNLTSESVTPRFHLALLHFVSVISIFIRVSREGARRVSPLIPIINQSRVRPVTKINRSLRSSSSVLLPNKFLNQLINIKKNITHMYYIIYVTRDS